MESIISKVHVELIDLAATYAEAGYENVTLSLISNFQRALFTLLNEKIRIKDLKQSEKLRDEIVQLFKDKELTKIA
jgi:outer membrane protein TolC